MAINKIDLDEIDLSNFDDDLDAVISSQVAITKKRDNDNGNIINEVFKNEVLDNPYTNITTAQLNAIELRLQGESQASISRKLKVSPSTVSKWFKNDDFMKIFDTVQQEIMDTSKLSYNSLLPLAINKLRDILVDPDTPTKQSLEAIKQVLGNSHLAQQSNGSISNNVTQITINSNYTDNIDVRDADNLDEITIDESQIIDV